MQPLELPSNGGTPVGHFEIDAQVREDTLVVSFAGEFELTAAIEIRRRLGELEADAPRLVVLDLRRVSFVDSTGLGLLVAAEGRARRHGRRLIVVRPAGPTRRIFDVTGLEDAFELVETLEEALDRR